METFTNCTPMCYGPSMKIFTKVSKPVYAHLRSKQSESAVYFDDNILFGNEFEDCLKRNCFFTKAVRFHNTR